MATYYVRKTGSNGAAGTSAGAAWETLTYALGATSGFASGDTLYIGAGRYDEALSIAIANPSAETFVIGDVTGQYTGDAGEVAWTAYTSGLDAAPGAHCFAMASRDYLTFRNICFYGGTLCIDATSATSTNITFTDCAFLGAGARAGHRINVTIGADVDAQWLFDRCLWYGMGSTAVSFTLTTGAGAEYDANIAIKNSEIYTFSSNGGNCINITNSGTTSGKGGGIEIHNCTIMTAGGAGVATTATHVCIAHPCYVYNCFILAGGFTALSAGTAGQIVENENGIVAGTRDANVTDGTDSQYESVFFAVNAGQERIWGGRPRRFGSPAIVGGGLSRLIGKGSDAAVDLSVDALNRPRPPVAAQRTWGAIEPHDIATKETSVTDAGGVAIKITGPYTQDIQIPVAAAATVITVRYRYDTNHGTGNKPQAILLANGEIGVAGETKTGNAVVDTWDTLTFSSFTPTAENVVTIRLVSRAAAATGIAYFDTVTVS